MEGNKVSTTEDPVTCPKCGESATRTQDTHTCEAWVYCASCGYDSDEDEE